jgi:flavorubredoxin
MSLSTQDAPPKTTQHTRQPQGFNGGIASLADDRLYALQNPFALDGRVSSYPASARGFSVANSYMLTQPDAAMLIDTGFGKDEPVIRAQVESLIAPGLPLSMFPLRLNEFMSINNVESFAGHFNVETCYTSNIDAALWFDFGAKAEGRDILKSMKVTAVTRADTIALGKAGRLIDVMQAPIRLIATRWLYDRATRTLFSSDMFTHVWRDTATGPWIVQESDNSSADNDSTSLRDVRSFMLNTRYWWLEGAPTDTIRRGIGNVFDKYDIECIAPGYGCILRGRNVVARHYAMLDEFLKACDKSVAVSRYVTRDEER